MKLTNAVGQRQARRLALMASRIGAEEAQRIGLVQQVLPLDRLDAALQGELVDAGLLGRKSESF